jgi:hypothetical protein
VRLWSYWFFAKIAIQRTEILAIIPLANGFQELHFAEGTIGSSARAAEREGIYERIVGSGRLE